MREQKRDLLTNIEKTKKGRNTLGNNGRNSSGLDSEMELGNKIKIEKNIENGSDNQEVECRYAIANSSKKSSAKIIGKGHSHTIDNSGDIEIRLRHNC
jgi:hypothetical protein